MTEDIKLVPDKAILEEGKKRTREINRLLTRIGALRIMHPDGTTETIEMEKTNETS